MVGKDQLFLIPNLHNVPYLLHLQDLSCCMKHALPISAHWVAHWDKL